MSMQNKPEHQYKIKLFKGCLCSVSAPEDSDYCKKKALTARSCFRFFFWALVCCNGKQNGP